MKINILLIIACYCSFTHSQSIENKLNRKEKKLLKKIDFVIKDDTTTKVVTYQHMDSFKILYQSLIDWSFQKMSSEFKKDDYNLKLVLMWNTEIPVFYKHKLYYTPWEIDSIILASSLFKFHTTNKKDSVLKHYLNNTEYYRHLLNPYNNNFNFNERTAIVFDTLKFNINKFYKNLFITSSSSKIKSIYSLIDNYKKDNKVTSLEIHDFIKLKIPTYTRNCNNGLYPTYFKILSIYIQPDGKYAQVNYRRSEEKSGFYVFKIKPKFRIVEVYEQTIVQ